MKKRNDKKTKSQNNVKQTTDRENIAPTLDVSFPVGFLTKSSPTTTTTTTGSYIFRRRLQSVQHRENMDNFQNQPKVSKIIKNLIFEKFNATFSRRFLLSNLRALKTLKLQHLATLTCFEIIIRMMMIIK